MGASAWHQQSAGQPAEALQFAREGPGDLEGAGPRLPDEHRLSSWLAVSLSKVGLLLDEMGRPTPALLVYQEALAIFDTRLRHLSSDTNVKAERADTINWIAAMQHKLGRTAEAIAPTRRPAR